MRKRRRANGRFAHWRQVELHRGVLRQRAIVQGRNLHEEIVRMLTVVQCFATIRLSGLQQKGIPFATNRERVEARHPAQLHPAARQCMRDAKHTPVDAANLRIAARPALRAYLAKHYTVCHDPPTARGPHVTVHRSRIRQPRRARAAARHRDAEWARHHQLHSVGLWRARPGMTLVLRRHSARRDRQ